MKRVRLPLQSAEGRSRGLPCTRVHPLVDGSGAAGLNAAAQLRCQGIEDVRILTGGLSQDASINTGSHKQTYYKLSMCGDDEVLRDCRQ